MNLKEIVKSDLEKLQERRDKLEKELEDLSEKLNEQKTELIKLSTEKDYVDVIREILSDKGARAQIIKKYLPLINQQVNRFLQIMDFYINFKLDEEFNETVESPIHEDFSYASFSEGEKSRIDLALIFAWREVARFKNSVNTNLMLFDEVFDSSLDSFGTDEFLRIIRFIIKDVNVFVISHKNGMEDKFEKVIRYEKVKGYSRIVS